MNLVAISDFMSIIDLSMMPIIFGKPLIVWGGIFTVILFILVFIIGLLLSSGKSPIDFKWHKRLAILAMASGLFHAIVGILIYFT